MCEQKAICANDRRTRSVISEMLKNVIIEKHLHPLKANELALIAEFVACVPLRKFIYTIATSNKNEDDGR